ncbi:unnamed protein product [Trichobilharzia szidati]|nr:unnamed protein product [Trichobilharzia szidati]
MGIAQHFAFTNIVFEISCGTKRDLYARRYCSGLCSRSGAQTFYCHLGCVERSNNTEQYSECIKNCTTHNGYMCKTVCIHDEEAPLVSCLFACAKNNPPTEECASGEINDARCGSQVCYKEDTDYLESHQ